ncbi:MAG TPA: helix-turn-helix domain-containing protein [Acidimicrobiia bacterium]|nr:helix-turn-helix domain-containing protein [Acidimicrobiia bacterium]
MTEIPRWEIAPDPDHDLILDARSMRAVAHPVRIRILGVLRTEGPQTATALAQKLSLNSGATSYHLRQLAEYGMIVEAPELGKGRERWWRASHRSTRYQSSAVDEDGAAYLQAVALVYAEHLQRAIEELPGQPEKWRKISTLNDYLFRLTPKEAASLVREVREVFTRYRALQGDTDPSAPAGAEPFHVQFHAFRLPGS